MKDDRAYFYRSWSVDEHGRLRSAQRNASRLSMIWHPSHNTSDVPAAPSNTNGLYGSVHPVRPPYIGPYHEFPATVAGVMHVTGGFIRNNIHYGSEVVRATSGYPAALVFPEPRGVERLRYLYAAVPGLFAVAAVALLIYLLVDVKSTAGGLWGAAAAAILLTAIFGCIVWMACDWCVSIVRRVSAGRRRLSPELRSKIRRNYPAVRIYPSVERMLADYPPLERQPDAERTPDNDPQFWTRH